MCTYYNVVKRVIEGERETERVNNVIIWKWQYPEISQPDEIKCEHFTLT